MTTPEPHLDTHLADDEPTERVLLGGLDLSGTLAPAPERDLPDLEPIEISRESPWLAPVLATLACALVMAGVLGFALGSLILSL